MKRYELYGSFAERYDLHTPPDHDRSEHELVLEELRRLGPGARVLDVGCGTGVFVERAREAGFAASGIDISPEMIAVAERRLGPGVVRVQGLKEVDERETYDALVSLAFPFNYCAGISEARRALAAFHDALRPGGLLLLQTIHAPHVLACSSKNGPRALEVRGTSSSSAVSWPNRQRRMPASRPCASSTSTPAGASTSCSTRSTG